MIFRLLMFVATAFVLLGINLVSRRGGRSRRPTPAVPAHVAYTDATIIPDHKTRAQLDQAVRTFYDAWKAAFVRQGCGVGRYYVALDGRPGTPSAATPISVSEGTGLGMLIVPHMAGHDANAQTRVRRALPLLPRPPEPA